MDLAGVQRLTRALSAAPRLSSITHNSTGNCTALIFSYGGLIHLGQGSDTVLHPWQLHPGCSRSSLGQIT